MARLRLGVVALVPSPTSSEIDGLRRACGDTALDRVHPHVTLVPPVNVSVARVPEALSVLRRAAAALRPFELTLGPVTTFSPDSPTIYLAVSGTDDDLAALHRLRDAVFEPPLHRELSRPYVPHVTIADGAPPDRIDAAVVALADYRVSITVGAVYMLQEIRGESGTQWTPVADYRFEPPIPVARGGIPIELWLSDLADPEARELLESEDLAVPPFGERTLTITARRRDEVVGVLWGHDQGAGSRAAALVVAPDHRKQGIAHHLHARFVSEVEAVGQLRRHT